MAHDRSVDEKAANSAVADISPVQTFARWVGDEAQIYRDALEYRVHLHMNRDGISSDFYDGYCQAFRTQFQEFILTERSRGTGREAQTQFYFWGAENGMIKFICLDISHRPDDTIELPFLEVSELALAQMVEELQTDNFREIHRELDGCALASIDLVFSEYELKDPSVGLQYTTQHGKATLGRQQSGLWAVIRWHSVEPGVRNEPSEAEARTWEEIRKKSNVGAPQNVA